MNADHKSSDMDNSEKIYPSLRLSMRSSFQKKHPSYGGFLSRLDQIESLRVESQNLLDSINQMQNMMTESSPDKEGNNEENVIYWNQLKILIVISQ